MQRNAPRASCGGLPPNPETGSRGRSAAAACWRQSRGHQAIGCHSPRPPDNGLAIYTGHEPNPSTVPFVNPRRSANSTVVKPPETAIGTDLYPRPIASSRSPYVLHRRPATFKLLIPTHTSGPPLRPRRPRTMVVHHGAVQHPPRLPTPGSKAAEGRERLLIELQHRHPDRWQRAAEDRHPDQSVEPTAPEHEGCVSRA